MSTDENICLPCQGHIYSTKHCAVKSVEKAHYIVLSCGQHYVNEMMKKKKNLKKLHINIFTQKYQRKSDAENIK